MKSIETIKKNPKIRDCELVLLPTQTATMTFTMKLPDCGTSFVVVGFNEDGMEHVSVSPRKKANIPSWNDMCILKDAVFEEEEEVYQLHPPKQEYVNSVENCLHLWRPKNGRRLYELKYKEKEGDC